MKIDMLLRYASKQPTTIRSSTMTPSGNTIFITGGGSGIGGALAQRFADLGNSVIVAGRRLDKLREIIDGRTNITAIALDVEDASNIERVASEVIKGHPDLNILVNNAGIMRYEALGQRRDLADAEATVVTNLLGPIRLVNAFVDHLRGQENAAIINVTSGLAFVPLVAAPTYSATKAAIHAYTIALREQLRGQVEVIELAPPAVQTDLTSGQATRHGYMPLANFIDETMALLQTQPTQSEILVERVKFLRFAEAEQRFDQAMAALNPN
jgi:uncharacterized oxidoreductase